MNAGKDYTRAKEQAQANANFFGVPYVLHSYGGVWWIERLSTYTNRIPDAAEIIKPEI